MTSINQDTILSTFSLFRSAIKANSILAKKFNDSNIFQFEPKHKGNKFKGFPYIWIHVPSSDSSKLVFDNSIVPHEFTIPMFLRMDWVAKDNVVNYSNAILKAIADYEATFQSSGYMDVMIDLIDTNPNQTINQRQVVEVEFSISVHGNVRRG